jgi:hypothetical protein
MDTSRLGAARKSKTNRAISSTTRVKSMTPERFYKILLNLYPREFRDQYGEEMTRVFQENLTSEGSSFKLWIQTFADVLSSATREHFQGGYMSLLSKLAAVSSVSIGVLYIFLLSIGSFRPPSNLEAFTYLVVHAMVFVGLLAQTAQQRNGAWWLAVTVLTLWISMALIGYLNPKSPVLDWMIQGSGGSYLSLFVIMCLSCIRVEQGRSVFPLEFWSLILLIIPVLLFILGFSFYAGSFGRIAAYLLIGSYISGWLVLGFALWSRASNPQPRALT